MKTILCIFLSMLAHCVCAAPQTLAPELAPLAAKYKSDIATLETQRANALAQAQTPYVSLLAAAEKRVTTAGDVAAVAAITAERAAFSSALMPPGFPPGMPKELQSPRKTYLDALARIRTAEGPRRQALDAAYLRALANLNARAASDPELAKQLAAEREKLLASAPDGGNGGKENTKSVVVNGNFELGDEQGKPRGWMGQHGEVFKVTRDGTNNVLHASVKVPGYASVTQHIILPPKARSVTIKARARAQITSKQPNESVFGGKILAVFLDARDVETKSWIILPSVTDAAWTTLNQTQKIPDDVKGLRLLLEVKRATGEFDFDDVVVEFR